MSGTAMSGKRSPLMKEIAEYTIDASSLSVRFSETSFRGGTNRNGSGDEKSLNTFHYLKNSAPWLPAMGEMHFSRYPCKYWEESIRKMKAAGIRIVSTYIFWIHHEEIEGEWNWSGNRDFRAFIELCADHGMYVFPRIGPWCHGECRNGGFPTTVSQLTDDSAEIFGLQLRGRSFTEHYAQLSDGPAFTYHTSVSEGHGFLKHVEAILLPWLRKWNLISVEGSHPVQYLTNATERQDRVVATIVNNSALKWTGTVRINNALVHQGKSWITGKEILSCNEIRIDIQPNDLEILELDANGPLMTFREDTGPEPTATELVRKSDEVLAAGEIMEMNTNEQ